MAKSNRIVLPGDEIAVAEEFIVGEGTYEADGMIHATTLGRVEKDMKNKRVRVIPLNPLAELKVGDVVYGKVTDIRSPIVSVEILKLKGVRRVVAGNRIASLHISNISSGYTTDLRDEMRIGDLIKAKVIQVNPSLQLSSSNNDLGVIKARCAKCRRTLVKRERSLYCSICDNPEPRNISDDYDRPPL